MLFPVVVSEQLTKHVKVDGSLVEKVNLLVLLFFCLLTLCMAPGMGAVWSKRADGYCVCGATSIRSVSGLLSPVVLLAFKTEMFLFRFHSTALLCRSARIACSVVLIDKRDTSAIPPVFASKVRVCWLHIAEWLTGCCRAPVLI
jgi:hypothetical protein